MTEIKNTVNSRMQAIVDAVFQGNKKAFALAINLAPTSISNYLGGQRASKPNVDILTNIVKLLGVDALWLLTGQGEMFPVTNTSPPPCDPSKETSVLRPQSTEHGNEKEDDMVNEEALRMAFEIVRSQTRLVNDLMDMNKAHIQANNMLIERLKKHVDINEEKVNRMIGMYEQIINMMNAHAEANDENFTKVLSTCKTVDLSGLTQGQN